MMIKDYYAKAVSAAETIVAVMQNDLRMTPPAEFYLDTTGERAWLIAVLNPAGLGGKIGAYTAPQTRHQLSTALGGKPVLLSNHSGLRYGILLSEKPKLPFPAPYPTEAQEAGSVPLGLTLTGRFHPPAAKLMNVLAGGEQGSGKSTLLHLFAYAAWLNGWKFYAADPRAMTFDETWNSITLAPVAQKADELLNILNAVETEMEKRASLFRSVRGAGLPAGNIDVYNDLVGTREKMPRIFLLVDEANTFLSNERIAAKVEDLSRQPRKFGIHFVLAGHNWRDTGVSRGISSNFHTRISLRVADDTSGRVVLNHPRWGKAMMKATRPGRAVAFLDGRFIRVQFYRLEESQVMEMLTSGKPQPVVSQAEQALAERALKETEGKISRAVLTGWGLSQGEANRIMEKWAARGWAEKDPQRDNATYVTQVLVDLLNNPTAPTTANNQLTTQTTAPTTPTAGLLGPRAA